MNKKAVILVSAIYIIILLIIFEIISGYAPEVK